MVRVRGRMFDVIPAPAQGGDKPSPAPDAGINEGHSKYSHPSENNEGPWRGLFNPLSARPAARFSILTLHSRHAMD